MNAERRRTLSETDIQNCLFAIHNYIRCLDPDDEFTEEMEKLEEKLEKWIKKGVGK